MTIQAKKKLLLIGGGGHCRSCIDVIRSTKQYDIVGILDIAEKVGETVDGVPVVGTDTEMDKYLASADKCLITVGQIGTGELREKLYQMAVDKKAELATVVSPNAYTAKTATLKSGTIVMHGAIVNAGATVAENVILNSFSLIEHDVCIGAHTHISTRATVNGGSVINQCSFLGSHAVVFNQIEIGEHSVIGGGQVVRQNMPRLTRPEDFLNFR